MLKPGADGGLLTAVLDAYGAEPDAVPVDVVVCGIGEQAAFLRDGRADVGVLHLPHDDPAGFDLEELVVEPAVAVLPANHALAGRTAIRMADLDGEAFPRFPGAGGDGPLVRDGGQLMQLIALGRAVAVLPESARRHLRADLVAVPVSDGPPTAIAVAWPEWSRSRAVAAFARAAARVAARVAGGSRAPHETRSRKER